MLIDSNDCSILKECQTLVKSATVSIRASKKHQQVQFTAFNDTTNILFYHQIGAKVESDAKLAVATERLVALLCRKDTKITLEYDGKVLKYKYRDSNGVVETFSFDTHERPEIKRDRVLTKTLKQNSGYLSLKSSIIEGVSNFIFVEEGADTYFAAADSGAYHAVLIKQRKTKLEPSQLTLPQDHVQNALRALKENIQICSSGEHLFCFTKTETTTSIIRFRNMVETSIKIEVIKNAVAAENALELVADSSIFDDIIADYRVSEDRERGGVIRIDATPKSVKMTCETRHGKSSLDVPVKANGTLPFSVSTKLLLDIVRLKGSVTIAVKQTMNIMTLTQTKGDLEVTFMCSVEKHA